MPALDLKRTVVGVAIGSAFTPGALLVWVVLNFQNRNDPPGWLVPVSIALGVAFVLVVMATDPVRRSRKGNADRA